MASAKKGKYYLKGVMLRLIGKKYAAFDKLFSENQQGERRGPSVLLFHWPEAGQDNSGVPPTWPSANLDNCKIYAIIYVNRTIPVRSSAQQKKSETALPGGKAQAERGERL